ncbi:MAG: Fur family transcriptional regulator [Pseudomonadota bacterium]
MTPLEQLCVQKGLRLTEHRRIVLEVLGASTDHPCAREIHRRAAASHRIGLATVYRTLNSLADVGVLTRRVFTDGRARYERAGGTHPHLIDLATGEILELEDGELERLIEETATRLGFRLVEYRLRMFGQKA